MSEYQTQNLPLLQRVDFSRGIPSLPPMSRELVLCFNLIRIFPSVIELLLGVFLWTNPTSADLMTLTLWINNNYGISSPGYAVWCWIFGSIALWWSFNAPFRRVIALRIGGMIIWTAPLLFYVLFADWYVLKVAQPTSRSSVLLYSGFYILILLLYLSQSLLAIWFEQVRRLKQ